MRIKSKCNTAARRRTALSLSRVPCNQIRRQGCVPDSRHLRRFSPVAHKHLLVESVAREKILRGALALADAVRVTLGPKSKCVLIEKKWERPLVCNDGVTIAKEFELQDHAENLGAQVVRQAAERTGEVVGDGSG